MIHLDNINLNLSLQYISTVRQKLNLMTSYMQDRKSEQLNYNNNQLVQQSQFDKSSIILIKI